ncbi:MAG: TolC family protein [Candidatus Omnitrophica bacterium]|nr:TolC family protein [Candidatus Omnitrophota bacterium]
MKQFITFFLTSLMVIAYVPGLIQVCQAAEEITLTFSEAVAIGLRDNRSILLKAQDVEKAKLKIAEAEGGLFPSLTYTGSWFYTAGLYTKNISQTNSQITLKQYLYQGGSVINNIKYNGYNLEVEQALLDKTKLETIFAFSKAYYTLLLTNYYTELNKGILENSREHLEYIKARYKNGQASETDILQAQASLSSVEQAYESSRSQKEAAQALLNNLLSLDKDVSIIPATEFTFTPKEVAFDQGFLKAMQDRPEIKQYESQIKADKANIEINKAGNRPSIYASWDYYGRSHAVTTTVNTRNWNDYNVFGVTFSWPIFDGWQTKAKVEQAIIDLKKSQIGKTKTIEDIVLDVKYTYLSLKDSIDQINASQADILFYKKNLATAEEKFTQGLISSLDKQDAQLKYAVSLFNQRQALYDYVIAKFNFDRATGGFHGII